MLVCSLRSAVTLAAVLTTPACAGSGIRPNGSVGGVTKPVPVTAGAQPEPAAAATNRALKPEDFKTIGWRSVGPANMGGRVSSICPAPGNAKMFLVGTGTGGLWKTGNAGTTFAPLFDKEATASIGSVVVCDAPPDWPGWKDEPKEEKGAEKPDPEKEKKKGKGKIVWVGTGEGNGRNSSSYGNGVYRSTDGGGTFKNVGLTDSHDIPALAADPRDPDVCYAAALGHLWGPNKERGLYKTEDGGTTWKAVLQIDENTGCIDVKIDPQNPGMVYAAMYMRRRTAYSYRSGGPEGGIYRSTDAGATWKKLTNGLPAQTGRIGLDIYRKDPKVVYAVVESDVGGWDVTPYGDRSRSGGVFRSEDGGDSWKRLEDHTPRGFYFSKIRVDPTDDRRVYRLGWGLDISDDGGRHFRAGAARKPHGDMHELVVDPEDHDHLLMGTDGGIYASYDRGETWDFLNGIALGEFYNVAVDDLDPYRIGGGLQDNGSWIGPSATHRAAGGDMPDDPGASITNADWQFVNDGDGFHVAFDPTDKNVVYAESQGGVLARVHLDTAKVKLLKPSPKEGSPRFRFNWNAPFFVSVHNPKTLYLGGNYVFRLTERGDTWERISEDLSTRAVEKLETVGSEAETHCTVVSLAESPKAAGTLWAGSDDGLVHVTTDDGKTWSNVTPPAAGGRYVSRIEAGHQDGTTAYVSLDGHRMDDMDPRVVMTTDLGNTWTDITGDLPKGAHVVVVREDLGASNVLYAGTERGIFVTIDRGGHWVRFNGESLPTVAVDDIVQHRRTKDLIVGTHGRSIYVLDDASAFAQMTSEVTDKPLHLFDLQPAKPHQSMALGGMWSHRMFGAPDASMGARITYWVREYDDEPVKITITDKGGAAVRSLGGSNRPGLNRAVWDLQREKYDQLPFPEGEFGQKQFVPPGEYTVTVTQGKKKMSRPVTVLAEP